MANVMVTERVTGRGATPETAPEPASGSRSVR
jgi:hypothetical protein